MSNPFFNKMNGGNSGGPFGNVMNFINQFKQFKANFQGDPREQVQNLLNTGQMSQEQFNMLSNMATQFQDMLK